MLDLIRSALAEIAQGYRDTRLQVCRLEASALDWARCALAGAVLDHATLAAVYAALAARFPAVTFDTSAVEVLRKPAPAVMTVVTNLTGLYAGPSFLAEMLSQLLNGAALEILQAQDRWRYVRQADGYLGWVYGPYLDPAPAPAATHLIAAPTSLLHAQLAAESHLTSRALGGTAVAAAVAGEWAHVTLAGGLTGWLPAADLRRLEALPADEASRRAQLVADAQRFVGVPYLWGGGAAFGIDCSGFAQLLHRLSGVTLPRDADMQFAAGAVVEPPFQPGDLLFFGEGDRRRITHVGLSLGGWRMIHSSRSRNGVYEDDVQATPHLRNSFVGGRTFVGRRTP